MYLKSLHIHGFKSFADQTEFQFHPGVTGIVGPNGCGKSNVVDAIRWVLGETSAKALRGGEMADVIFNGAERRKALGMAEVTLTLADCEEALKTERNEVSVTRRVYRDGKSEYLINGSRCRLRDIGDLFMDTGIGRSSYSIMEQGKIDMLLSARPEDRRQVFEEAAGITKSKREKKDALRKLEHTDANLLRVSDVLAEQGRRMSSLKRQVEKARRYQSLSRDVHILDTHLSHRLYQRLVQERAGLGGGLSELGERREELEELLPEQEEVVTKAREEARKLDQELAEMRRRLAEKRSIIENARSRIAFNNERKGELAERLERNAEEIKETEERILEQQKGLEETQGELAELEKKVGGQQAEMARREEAVRKAEAVRGEVEREKVKGQQETNRVHNRVASCQAKIESARGQLEGQQARLLQISKEAGPLEQELAVTAEKEAALAAKLEEHRGQLPVLEAAADQGKAATEEARSALESVRRAGAESHRALTQKRSRLEVLRDLANSGEGLEKGTRAVLKGLNDPDLIKPALDGVFSARVSAPDEYAAAVESILGPWMEAVVVREEELANEIIDRLVEKKLGGAALLVKPFLPPKGDWSPPKLPEGAEAWALDLVKVESGFEGLVDQLLAKVVVVKDRVTALALRRSHSDLTFVTKDGGILSPEGLLKGGSRGKGDSVLKRRNEVRALEAEVLELEQKEKESAQAVADAEARGEELRMDLEKLREAVQKHRVEESTQNGNLKVVRQELTALQSRLKANAAAQEDMKNRAEAEVETQANLEKELKDATELIASCEASLSTIEGRLESARAQEEEAKGELNEFRTSLAVEKQALNSAASRQDPMMARLRELRDSNLRRQREITASEERMAKGEEENQTLQSEIESATQGGTTLKEKFDAGNARREEVAEVMADAELGLTQTRQELDEVSKRLGKDEISSAKLDLQLENLLTATQERHQVDLQEFEPDPAGLLLCIAERKDTEKSGKRQKIEAPTFKEVEERSGGQHPDRPEQEVATGDDREAENVEGEEKEEEEIDLEVAADWDFIRTTVVDLKRRLDSMGPVNIDAIQEYEELAERHSFTQNQHDDLVASKEKLLEIIDRINNESERLFAETFKAVAKNFRGMFKRLFGEKGKADLILQDEENPLECGIDVIARPPGKKLQSITLMSGGERSMTAVALLFSIYMVKPSPFCVLDELDAPLDESNIGRFLKVLDAFIDQSQFIIVTHSKRTMERADVMYGVTMEEFGVSKPVGMRLTDEIDKLTEPQTAAQRAALKLDA